MKIIGIIGSRTRNSEDDYDLVFTKFMELYKNGDKICSGGCPKGGDRFAEIRTQSYPVKKESEGCICNN